VYGGKFSDENENEYGAVFNVIIQSIYFTVCSCIYRVRSDKI